MTICAATDVANTTLEAPDHATCTVPATSCGLADACAGLT
jgi:hypothetical protein